MTNVKKNEQFVPMKNYLIAAVVVVVIILLAWYAFAWYKVVNENRVSTSYLVKEKVVSNEIKSLEEVSTILSEAPTEYYIYISYTGSEDIYNMEKDLKSVIKDYGLSDKIYYLNVTDIKDKDNYLEDINKSLNLDDIKVSNIPTIVYYKEGTAVDIITRSDNNIMNVGDFQKLLDRNRVEKNKE